MENKKKKYFFFVKLGFFCLELGKNILFGIGNGVEFPPQNRVIESPALLCKMTVREVNSVDLDKF